MFEVNLSKREQASMRKASSQAEAVRWTMKEKMTMLSKVRGLVIKLAWESWRMLPPQTKVWVDPDDLIEECYLHVLDGILERYDGRAGYTTYLWWTEKNHLIRWSQKQLTQKRFAFTVPIEDAEWLGNLDNGQKQMEAEDAILWVYAHASPMLRHHMRLWFSADPQLRIKKSTRDVILEFRSLANSTRLKYDDCLRLIKNGMRLQQQFREEAIS